MAALISINTDSGIRSIELQSGINTVGRAAGNTHVLPHPSVSSRHCEIVVTDGSVRLRDLGSTNGTAIEGERSAEGGLQHGQHVAFGDLVFQLDAPELLAAPGPGPLRVNVPVQVRTVETAERPATNRTAAEAIAAVDLSVLEEPGFFQQLPGVFRYPFNGSGLILLIAGTVVFAFLNFISTWGGLVLLSFKVFVTGYIYAYMQKIILASVNGDREMPDFPDFTEWWSDIILPFLLFTGTALVSFAPYFLVRGFMEDGELKPLALGAAAGFGLIYLPMALLAVAVTDNFLALSPHVVAPSILRVLRPYLVTCLVCGVVVALQLGGEWLLDKIPLPILSALVLEFIELYSMCVMMRVLGLLYRAYRARLGWLG